MFYSYTGDIYFIKQKIKDFNVPIVYVDSIQALKNEPFETGLFDDVKCYITIDETIPKTLINKYKKSPNIIIDILINPKTNTEVYKQSTEIVTPTKDVIIDMLHKQSKLPKDILNNVFKLCNNDITYTLLEINKIQNSDYDLLQLNMIGDTEIKIPPLYNTYFTAKNYKPLFLLNHNVTSLDILSIFVWIFNSMVTILMNGGNSKYTVNECKDVIKDIYKLRKDMLNGLIEPEVVLDIFLINRGNVC